MKAIIKYPLILFMAVTVIGLSACSKDNVVEFTSTGEWKIDRYYLNGNDATDAYLQNTENYLLNLKVGHDFTETAVVSGNPYGVSGTWEVVNTGQTLRLYDESNGTREYSIVNATTSSLKIKKGAEQWDLKRP